MPDKNIRLCCGIPLVKRAVDLAKECGFFDRIILSTESPTVKTLSTDLQGDDILYHKRPEELCRSTSSVWDAVAHYGYPRTDYICLLHPTSPCLRVDTITDAFREMVEYEDIADALVSVHEVSPYVWSANNLHPDFSKALGTQFSVPKFSLNNALIIAKWVNLYEVVNVYKLKWIPYNIPLDEAIDIDNETDFTMAEAILHWRLHNEKKEDQ